MGLISRVSSRTYRIGILRLSKKERIMSNISAIFASAGTQEDSESPYLQQQLKANPIQGGYNFRVSIPVPKDVALVNNKQNFSGWELLTANEKFFGDQHCNRYWDGLSKAELWLGIQKHHYTKDGSWINQSTDQFDQNAFTGKTTHQSPNGADNQHP